MPPFIIIPFKNVFEKVFKIYRGDFCPREVFNFLLGFLWVSKNSVVKIRFQSPELVFIDRFWSNPIKSDLIHLTTAGDTEPWLRHQVFSTRPGFNSLFSCTSSDCTGRGMHFCLYVFWFPCSDACHFQCLYVSIVSIKIVNYLIGFNVQYLESLLFLFFTSIGFLFHDTRWALSMVRSSIHSTPSNSCHFCFQS